MKASRCLLIFQCLAHPSSEKLPPEVDGKRYREQQSDNSHTQTKTDRYTDRHRQTETDRYRWTDIETLSPKLDVSIKPFPSELRKPSKEEAERV